MNSSKTECPHKWVSIYVTDWIDYECKLCGKNLFDTYGADKFRSGELKVSDFYTSEKDLLKLNGFRTVKMNSKFLIQKRELLLWWDWWVTLEETVYDDIGSYSFPLKFNSLNEVVDYLIKVNEIKRFL